MTSSEADPNEVRIARIDAFKAIVLALIAILASSITWFLTTIGEEPEQMPLQGEWSFKMTYSRFQNQPDGKWRAEGVAVFSWDQKTSMYSMLLGAGVRDLDASSDEPEVIYVLRSTIPASAAGTPKSLEIPFQYVTRAARSPSTRPASDSLFKLETLPSGPTHKFQISYTSNTTEGKGVFTRSK
jgi:hypothetical protein